MQLPDSTLHSMDYILGVPLPPQDISPLSGLDSQRMLPREDTVKIPTYPTTCVAGVEQQTVRETDALRV